jgi:hydroxymethylpyrimidine kinase/phosphomethylpyrimidine kinase
MEKKIALTIAGSDSSAGAGIQADLKSFTYLGVYGVTVLTCITAQNTHHVRTIHPLPVSLISDQLDSLFEDLPITAVKTGMLYDEEIITVVAKHLKKHRCRPVVDPVMTATSGDTLTNHSFMHSLTQDLLPQALMVTANIPEATTLTDLSITTQDDIEHTCKKIKGLGPDYVLIKGGHLPGDMATDVLYDGNQFHRFTLPKIPQKKAHGSGCTLSALITGFLALKDPPIIAVQKAKSLTWGMIQEGYIPGKGADVLNHTSIIHPPPRVLPMHQFQVWFELNNAIQTLLSFLTPDYIPQVGMNFAYAVPHATTRQDICAVDGRITTQKNHLVLCGSLDFGASKHVASIILAAMTTDPMMRSALNIRYTNTTVDLCKKTGLAVGTFERINEPATAGSTMEWGTKQAILTLGKVPDVIYDTGGVGKEPMIRILGKNPEDVISKLKKITSAALP